jgi:putative transposase
LDFGLVEFGVENAMRLQKYRDYLYHAGAIKKRGGANISKTALDEEKSNGFQSDRIRRFRFRTRYFTDSGIICSKTFVLATYDIFKDRLYESRERVPKRVKGVDGMYSMKRLTEA